MEETLALWLLLRLVANSLKRPTIYPLCTEAVWLYMRSGSVLLKRLNNMIGSQGLSNMASQWLAALVRPFRSHVWKRLITILEFNMVFRLHLHSIQKSLLWHISSYERYARAPRPAGSFNSRIFAIPHEMLPSILMMSPGQRKRIRNLYIYIMITTNVLLVRCFTVIVIPDMHTHQ